MPSIETSFYLFWLVGGIHFLSLVMLGVIFVQWNRRKAEGFSLGERVRVADWDLTELLQLLMVLIFAYSQILALEYFLQKRGLIKSDDQKAIVFITFQVIFYGVFFFMVKCHLQSRSLSWSSAFGFRATRFREVIVPTTVSLIAILIPLEILEGGTYWILKSLGLPVERQPVLEFFLRLHDPWLKAAMVFLAVIGAPMVEEILFRGIIYPSLKRKFGFFHALWITSAVFAMIHFHLPSTPTLFGLAIAFTLLYEWTGNLAACIFFHASFNACSMILAILNEKSF